MKRKHYVPALLFLIISSALHSQNDSCYVTFQKTFGGTGKDLGYQIAETLDGNYIEVGYTSSFGNGGYDGFLQKLNQDGSIAWCTVLGGSGNDYLYHVCPTTDSGYVATGQTLSFGGGSNGVAWIAKVNGNGNLLWSKKYDDGNTHGSAIFRIVQTMDGGYAACGENKYDPASADLLVIKTDSVGEVQWAKIFDSGDTDFAYGIYPITDSILITGVARGGNTYYDGIIMKLKLVNGHMEWARKYDIESANNWFIDLKSTDDGYVVRTLTTDDWTEAHPRSVIVNIDKKGYPVSLSKIESGSFRTIGSMFPTSDSAVFLNEYDENDSADSHLYKIDASGTVLWNRLVAGFGKQVLWGSGIQTTDGSYLLTGYNNTIIGEDTDMLIVKVDTSLNIFECLGETNGITITTPGYSFDSLFDWNSKNTLVVEASDIAVTQEFISFTDKTICYHCSPNFATVVQNTVSAPYTLAIFPNPFSNYTTLQLSLEKSADLTIELLDVSGRKIKTITKGKFRGGSFSLDFSAETLPKGIYLLQLKTDFKIQSQKLIVQ